MRFVGQTEVAASWRTSPALADLVRAWLTEIKRRQWEGYQALASDFRERRRLRTAGGRVQPFGPLASVS